MLGQHEDMTMRNVMKAILLTAGPVSTHQTVKQNWRFLRMLNIRQFTNAAHNLQETLQLGTLVSLKRGKQTLAIFAKKPPEQVREILELNSDLPSPEIYAYRFGRSSPKCISLNIQAQMVSMGYVAEQHFRHPTN